MFLWLSTQDFLEKMLEIDASAIAQKFLAKNLGRTRRQIREYMRTDRAPRWIRPRLQASVEAQGWVFHEEVFNPRLKIPASWQILLDNWLRQPEPLLPQTLRLLLDLAERDVVFLKNIEALPDGQRLGVLQTRLADEVVPFFCLDAEPMVRRIRAAPEEAALRPELFRLFLESLLSLLAFAEAEYVTRYEAGAASVLAKFLPLRQADKTLLRPSQRFFQGWMRALDLKSRTFIQEMLDHYGDPEGEADSTPLEFVTREGLKKSFTRYVVQGERPTWETLRKWARGLHARAQEVQGRTDSFEDYERTIVEWYGGVRMLEKLFLLGGKLCSTDDLLALFATYPRHFERQIAAVKKGTGTGPVPA